MRNPGFRWFVLVLFVAILATAGIFLYSISALVKLLVVCALLAYVLDPVTSYFESFGLSRAGATILVFVAIGGVMASLGVFVYPAFVEQIRSLQKVDYAGQTNALLGRLENLIRARFAFLGFAQVNLVEAIQRAQAALGKNFSTFLFTDVVSTIAYIVAIPFIIFFILKDGREMKKRLISLVPNRYFEFTLNLLHRMDLALGNYLRGQFVDALIFGALSMLAMWMLNVNYFLFIGLFAGLANLVPYVGPIAGASLAVVVVFVTTSDVVRVVYVLLAFMVIKLLDDVLIQPIAVAKSVKMHPLLILLVIIVGGHFFGILGMLLAVPVAGFVKVGCEAASSLYQKYRRSRLGERPAAATARLG